MAHPRAVVVATLLAAASVSGWWLGDQRRTAQPEARVIRAVDGDTVVVALAGGRTDTIRLLGVDTPETHHPTKPVGCFGPEAAAYTARRLTGRLVHLEGDVETRDMYGRRLAYLILDGRRFNDELLRRGYGRLLVIAPNGAHARVELEAELSARHEHRGLWAQCTE
jgi:micrococcal nuclease